MFSSGLPDVALNPAKIASSVHLTVRGLHYLQCAKEENCLSDATSSKWSQRWDYYPKLLRFSAFIENRGLTDFEPRAPKAAWQWHACHRHYHSVEVFTHYDLLSELLACHAGVFGCLSDVLGQLHLTNAPLWREFRSPSADAGLLFYIADAALRL